MELPKIGKSGGMFDEIKSKLGFSSEKHEEYDEESYYDDQDYDDDFDTNGDYGEYSYDASADYENEHSSGYGGSRSSSSSPRLVSIDDVRSRTHVPDNLKRDPLPERHVTGASGYVPASTSSYRSSSSQTRLPRTVERAADYLISNETSDLPPHGISSNPRSPGFNSLFSATGDVPSAESSVSSRPREQYATSPKTEMTLNSAGRRFMVIKLSQYSDVQNMVEVVKDNGIVVLSTRNIPRELTRRIIDFSSGVAFALELVICKIATDVYVVGRSCSLTSEETEYLRTQGVL